MNRFARFFLKLLALSFVFSNCVGRRVQNYYIVFSAVTYDGDLSLIGVNSGELESLTEEHKAREWLTYSPQKKLIAFSKWDEDNQNLDVWLFSLVDRKQKRLTNTPYDEAWPCISPDGSKVAFASNRDGHWQIYLLDINDKKIKKLTNSKTDSIPESWAPDGRRLAFVVGDQARGKDLSPFIIDVESRNIKPICKLQGSFEHLNWSPDGRFIVCVYAAEGRERYQNDIYIIDIRTQKLIRLTNDIATKANPCFSPDGEKIAFLSNKERKDGLMDLYIMDIKGRKRQRLTHLPTPFTFGGIVWITKETICGVKQYRMEDIYIMEKQTGRIRRLTNNVNMPRNIFPNLSPDGEKIVFNSFVDGNWEIYVMDINGRNLKRLIHNPADDFSPCWTPDNKEIIFWSSRKPPGLYIMDESGRNIRRLPIPSTMTPTSHSCSPVLKNLQ